jgi:hypothetical protein
MSILNLDAAGSQMSNVIVLSRSQSDKVWQSASSWSRLESALLAAVGEVASVFGEEAPGFAEGFVVMVWGVATGAGRGVGIDGEVHFRFGEKNGGAGDEVPGLGGQDVEGEQVDEIGAVALDSGAAMAEAAEVSAAFAGGESLDLHAQKAAALFDAEVVGEGVSARFQYVISARGGGRHEYEFDPLAALFEILSPTSHPPAPDSALEIQKARPGGPRLSEYLVSISSLSISWGATGKGWRLYIWNGFIELSQIV